MKLYEPQRSGQPMMRENTVPIYVADSLDSLRGPTAGTLKLPLHLDWTAAPVYDLDDPQRVLTRYATVLREAKSEADLTMYLNHQILLPVWSDLRIPAFVRGSWESKYPELVG
jgi:hypothetical protein